MINTHDYRMEMQEEARRSKERVRQLLAIQIKAQVEQEHDARLDEGQSTWTDVSLTGEFEAISV